MTHAPTRTLIIDAIEAESTEIKIRGWVRLRRDHGKLVFLDVRDRTGIIQVVVNPSVSEEAYKAAQTLRPEDVVEIDGKVNKRPGSAVNKGLQTGMVELEAKAINVLSSAETLPFDMGGETLNLELPTLLDYRSLVLRHPKIAAIFKIQETIAGSFRNTLKESGFTEIFIPTIVPTATEGGAEVFKIEYYDKKAYLAQSPQLYKQIMVSIFERVFTIAHAYRAEPSITTRHLSEYVSLDAEMGFIENWTELMDTAEKIIVNLLKEVSEKNEKELLLLGVTIPSPKNKIPRVKMREAQELIFKRTGVDHRNEPDLEPSDEKELCKWAIEENGAPFVFITHYPTSKRPFYTMPDPEDPEFTLSFDMLGVAEEWVTGGQRINDYQMLVENMKKRKINPEQFETYLQSFKYGMPPEGGFAMGIERITRDLLGLSNVREASLFPRDMERVDERLSNRE
jgi:nondiscriminating aspartyl-tRNA synthetase